MGLASLTLIAGVVLAGLGGELFVRGVLGFARWARIPAAIAAATLGAFATSSPEAFVSTTAALAGKPTIGLGDATGSNVVNIALVLALALLLQPVRAKRRDTRFDIGSALGTSALLGVLAADGTLGRADGIVLLAVFAAWVAVHVRRAMADRTRDADAGRPQGYRVILECAAGLILLVAAGQFVVGGAKAIAEAFGIPAFVVGATLVALGTSTPELATSLVAQWRGHDHVSLGTLLGSNVFNGLFIVGLTSVITPIAVESAGVWIALGAATIAVAACWPGRSERLGRHRGVLLIGVYAVYLSLLAVFATH